MTHRAGRHFLQIPGPSPVPDRVLRAISAQTMDHRGPEFAEVGRKALDGMKTIFKTEQHVFIYPSSGTGAWEAAQWIGGRQTMQGTVPLELDVLVTRAKADKPAIPSYNGGKFPLTTFLADRVRHMIHDPDQYSTDFGKAVKFIRSSPSRQAIDIVVIGGLGGRVDQGMATLSHLYTFQPDPAYSSGRMYLLSSESITFVLKTGTHKIQAKEGFDGIKLGKHVGIIPLKERVVDRYYDPIKLLFRKLFKRNKGSKYT